MNKNGQNVIEYLLYFAAVVVVIIFSLGPNGFITKAINRSVTSTVVAIEQISACTCYDNEGVAIECENVCGNGCCQPEFSEDATSCADCSICGDGICDSTFLPGGKECNFCWEDCGGPPPNC